MRWLQSDSYTALSFLSSAPMYWILRVCEFRVMHMVSDDLRHLRKKKKLNKNHKLIFSEYNTIHRGLLRQFKSHIPRYQYLKNIFMYAHNKRRDRNFVKCITQLKFLDARLYDRLGSIHASSYAHTKYTNYNLSVDKNKTTILFI